MNKKRGQVAIFVIVGVVIVSAVILFFLLRSGTQKARIGEGEQEDLEGFLQTCLEDKVREGVDLISKQGGYISNPLNISFKLEEEDEPVDISYLCYTNEDYAPCVNQEPVLFRHLGEEIKSYIEQDSRGCFNNLISNLESRGFSVSKENYNGLEVNLQPRKVTVNVNGEITATKSGETARYENFEVEIGSRLNELAMVVQDIVNSEALSCDFKHEAYLINKPEFRINKYMTSDSSEIYRIKHQDSGKEFRFAVRSCPISPGWP